MLKNFEWNKKYINISLYSIFVIVFSILFHKITNNWESTKISIDHLLHLLSPFLYGFLFAFLLNPGVSSFETFYLKLFSSRYKKNKYKPKKYRTFAIFTMYVFILGFITLILLYIAPQITNNLSALVNDLPNRYESLEAWVNNVSVHTLKYNIDLSLILHRLENSLPKTFTDSENMLEETLPMLFNASKSLTSGVLNLVLGIIISIYLINEKENFLRQLKKITYALFTKDHATAFLNNLKESNDIFKKFFIGKAIDSLIIGIICFVGMIILQFPYALLISVIVGITNMIPYFGPIIGAIPGVVIIFLINPNPLQALWFLVFILALQQFDGNILGPKILGDAVGLSPFWIIFSVMIGGGFFGVIGMFLSVPVFAVIYNFVRKFIDSRLFRKNINPENIDNIKTYSHFKESTKTTQNVE